MVRGYDPAGDRWCTQVVGQRPHVVCILGFTATALLPGISAAGATPQDRQFTAIADAEFLYHGPQLCPHYPLPPLQAGASPVLITKAVVDGQQLPLTLFNAGLHHTPPIPAIDLGGQPAGCVSSGQALSYTIAAQLFQQGLVWGDRLSRSEDYLVVSECVVGGTTTALAVLLGLGWAVSGMVNSSHPTCNHGQKDAIARQGLAQWQARMDPVREAVDPIAVVAAVGDPMQLVAAGMAIAASRPVLLAGGTQMLAVYALAQAIATHHGIPWQRDRIAVGTTRWVVDDPTGNTLGLAKLLQAPLLSTQLSFAQARYAQLRAYEQGYVKEGVGAGGAAIAATLYQGWTQTQLLTAIEQLAARLDDIACVNGGHHPRSDRSA
jgi:uncharacterized protein (TIGR00303 family)